MKAEQKQQFVTDLGDFIQELINISYLVEEKDFEQAFDELETQSGTIKTLMEQLKQNNQTNENLQNQ